MTVERKDVRFKLPADVHQCLSLLAELEGKDIAIFVEQLVVNDIQGRVHRASVLASRASEVGLARKPRD